MNQKRRGIRPVGFFMVLCLLMSICLFQEKTQAFALRNTVPDSVQMELQYGLQGKSHISNKVPVYIKLTANGNTDFSGTLSVETATQDYVRSGITYVINSLLPNSFEEPYNQVIESEIPVSIKGGEAWKKSIYVLTRYNVDEYKFVLRDERGEVVCEESLSIEAWIGNMTYVAGIVSDKEAYSEQVREASWPYSQIVELQAITPVLLKPEELTVENLDGDMPDLLIFEGSAKESLSVAQQVSLEDWQERGGILLENIEVQSAKESLEEALQQADVNKICDRVVVGNGRLDFSSYLLTGMPIRRQANILLYGLILAVYAVAVGPGFYLLLKKLGKRYHLWSGMMLLSLGFVILIGFFTSGTRIRAPFLTYVEIMQQRKDCVEEAIDLGIQAPFNSSYNMYVDNSYSLIPWMPDSGMGSNEIRDTSNFGNINISYLKDKKKITVSDFPAFVMNQYYLARKKTLEQGKGLSADIQVFDGYASGTVSNQTDYDMKNVVVLMPSEVVWVGDIKSQETLTIRDQETVTKNDVEKESYYLDKKSDLDREQRVFEQNAWVSVLSSKNITTRADSLVMGQITNQDTPWQLDTGYEAFGYSYYFAPSAVSMMQGDKLYCPYVQQYRSDESIPYISGLAHSYAYMSEDEYTATYHLNDILEDLKGKSLQVEKISFVENKYGDRYTRAFNGEIDLYNYETKEFNSIEWSGKTVKGEELRPYLNQGNEITIRYRLGKQPVNETKTYIIPHIQMIGKVEGDAEN